MIYSEENVRHGKRALVHCEMCCWLYQPRTRKGIRKALLLHRRCGFKP